MYIDYFRKNKMPVEREYMRDVLLNFLIAGRDTTAGSITFFMAQVSKPENKEWEAKLLEEIETVCGPSNSGGSIEYSHATKMHIHLAFMYETLRLFPSVPR